MNWRANGKTLGNRGPFHDSPCGPSTCHQALSTDYYCIMNLQMNTFSGSDMPKKRHPAFAGRRAGDAITGGVMAKRYVLVWMRSSSMTERKILGLTARAASVYVSTSSPLFASAAGCGAASSEAAPAYFLRQSRKEGTICLTPITLMTDVSFVNPRCSFGEAVLGRCDNTGPCLFYGVDVKEFIDDDHPVAYHFNYILRESSVNRCGAASKEAALAFFRGFNGRHYRP